VRIPQGFTLIELMIGLAVLGTLVGLAAPSMKTMLQNNRMTSAANDMLTDLNAARNESLRRRTRIVICKSSNGTSCSTSALWTDGWLMYLDPNSNTALDAGEFIFRVRQGLPSGITIAVTGFSNTLVAHPVGTLTPTGTFKLCDDRTGNFGRTITVAASGRSAVTTTACP
jgi:type IV fimbrial biogenesis protein FimT